MIPKDLKYSKTHEWVSVAGKTATVGITAFAMEQLGDVVFIELPKAGDAVEQGSAFGVIESVKAAVDLNSPVSGTMVEANQAVTGRLDSIGDDPYGESWMVKIELSNPAELENLMDAPAYEAFLKTEAH